MSQTDAAKVARRRRRRKRIRTDGAGRLVEPGGRGNPSSKWIVVWSEQGRSKRVSTRTDNKAVAETFLATWKNNRAKAAHHTTVNDVLDAYAQAAKDTTSDVLLRNRLSALRLVREHFGALAPEAISPRYVEEYVRTRLDAVSKRTVSLELAYFRAALNRARDAEAIQSAPAIKLPQAKARARRRVLTGAELTRLLAALDAPETPPHLAGFVALSIYTGQRGKHVRALLWRDVDMTERRIYFTRSNPEAAENKQTADVYMAKALLPILERLRTLARTPFVIEWEDAPVSSLKRSWAGLLRRAQITDLRIHDLRRSFATFAAKAGASLPDVAALMNLDAATLQRHYSHGSPIGREIIERIGDE